MMSDYFLPSLVAFNTDMSAKGLSFVAASLVEPKNDQQKEIVAGLPASSNNGLFSKLPTQSAMALSFDGPFLKYVLETASKRDPARNTVSRSKCCQTCKALT